MHLTSEEERIFRGEEGWALQKAMEILVALGDIHHASHLIPIQSAHISGASYKTIGDAFEFIKCLEGARVRVKSTLNPTGVDRKRWQSLNVSETFVTKQREVVRAYSSLGIDVECTCIPYHVGNRPQKGEHIAWAESSAVLYANAVLGARTNMEGAPSALAAALIGKTPCYGLHLTENREPELRVCVRCALHDADYSALGFLLGELVGNKVPVIELLPVSQPTADELKHLSAAIGATGSVGLYHLAGCTPESDAFGQPAEMVELEKHDIESLNRTSCQGDDDVIAIGCPHCSAAELQQIYELLRAESRGRKVRKEFFVFTARAVKERMQAVVRKIETYGVQVICDTCFVVSPAFEHYRCVITNSGKMMRYVPLLCGGAAVQLCTTESCVQQAF